MLTHEEFEKVLAKCHVPHERLMLIVLWETGCRNDTLRHLKWVDLRKDETIFLKGKRGHERYVSMDRSIFTELFAFKKGLGDLNKEKKFIWVNPDT